MRIFNYLFLFLLVTTTVARGEGVFISAPDRKDMVYDDTRKIIYISSGPEVLRYSTNTGAFLSPFVLGGDLNGMDLSPDGNVLAVADKQASETTNHVHLINLESEIIQTVEFPLAFMEGGTWTVSFGNDGQLLITSMFNGSGWVPMRRYNLSTDAFTTLSSVRQNSMIAASGNASKILYVEANISSGPVGCYDVAAQSLLEGASTNWFTYEVATNRNGTHISVPTYGGTFIFDNEWNNLGTLGEYAGAQPKGVVYHPVENLVYYPWSDTQMIYVYETATNTLVDTIDFENIFEHTGNAAFVMGRSKISRDGSLLMVTVTGGVRYLRMYEALSARDVTLSAVKNMPSSVSLEGAIGNSGSISYEIVTPPTHGNLVGVGPELEYQPHKGSAGGDHFSYAAIYGRARAIAEVNITIINASPVANSQSITVDEDVANNPIVLTGSDIDEEPLIYTVTSSPAHGTLSSTAPNLFYTPNPNYFGVDAFTFNVNDGSINSPDATVTITINDMAEAGGTPDDGGESGGGADSGGGGGGGGCFISTAFD